MARLSVDDAGSRQEEGQEWEAIDVNDIEFGARIGGGGFAVVYEGWWKDKAVALKAMFDPRADDAQKREYMDELHVMSQVKHEHIVRLFGACTRPPKLCMVMELCEQSLFDFLHRHNMAGGSGVPAQQATEHELIGVAAKVADAMAYLHGLSPAIIHRDMKSQNVLLTADLSPKLCDFGLVASKVVSAGTPSYMAPELLDGKAFSKKVDVYAFGIMLWEMLARQMPFQCYPAFEIKEKVLAGERPAVPYSVWSEPIVDIIERAWHKRPGCRPGFAEVSFFFFFFFFFVELVAHACVHGSTHKRPPPPPPPTHTQRFLLVI